MTLTNKSMKEQKTSRSHLYNDSQSEYESETESIGYSAPNLEFEFIEVDTNEPVEEEKEVENNDKEEEFEFPLFSMGENTENVDSEKKQPMTVSLKETEEEIINQERPESYYFTRYSPEKIRQFEICALDVENIIEPVYPSNDAKPWKCIDLIKYNAEIEVINSKEKRKSRPGKKKREGKIICRQRRNDRIQLAKKLKVEQNILRKKMFHKRGGKKNKQKSASNAYSKTKQTTVKPKYRTE